MLRRLFLVLQSVSLIPPIIMFPVWLNSFFTRDSSLYFFFLLLTLIPFTLVILSKYILWGKFYIFKIEEEKIIVGEEKIIKKRMSQSEYDSMIRKEKEQ